MTSRIPGFFGGFLPLLLAIALTTIPESAMAQSTQPSPQDNKALIRKAFDDWKSGRGSVFDLLADDAEWTIAGASLAAGTYAGKEEFMDKVIRPFNARVTRPLSPTIRQIHADGDTVVVLFDAETVATDGKPYLNTYAWFLRLENGRITQAVAFFDTAWFDDLWTRVHPAEAP